MYGLTRSCVGVCRCALRCGVVLRHYGVVMACWSCGVVALPWFSCLVCLSVLGVVTGVVSPAVSGVLFVLPRLLAAAVYIPGLCVGVLVSPCVSGLVLVCPGVCVLLVSRPSGCDVMWVCPWLHSGVGAVCW